MLVFLFQNLPQPKPLLLLPPPNTTASTATYAISLHRNLPGRTPSPLSSTSLPHQNPILQPHLRSQTTPKATLR
ncbi:hypothetical protein JHK82_018320 [Glycine max]|uniref:Uncharacterized protein n=2 Tax=Glycine subgen. Soja TaxID=1462606 RepID=A0A0R0J6N7_SOYBN|nr:hypothetical protein JHK87_018206 [Glycine soja]KAG5022404.1 hypothetical protein JHK85_018746 [Glycine max]KAG5037506.1 hypothetical protein JHK86_018346 [Glycine max]KAG5142625.1 hypothetical protein JHK82_018320 [Glycine max]KAH1086509.1 hypothetical protein GYH30_018162 [Glycine max]